MLALRKSFLTDVAHQINYLRGDALRISHSGGSSEAKDGKFLGRTLLPVVRTTMVAPVETNGSVSTPQNRAPPN